MDVGHAGQAKRNEQFSGMEGDWTRTAELNQRALKGACGAGRDISVASLQSLVAGTPHTITMHRYQAADLGFGAQHGFAIIVFPGQPAKRFIVDPTISQFLNRFDESGDYSGGSIREQTGGATVEGMRVVRDIQRDGFTPLTPESAAQYMIALGADQAEAQVAAATLLSGQASVQSDYITGTHVERGTDVPPASIPGLDIDVHEQKLGGKDWELVNEINTLLSSGHPRKGSPLHDEMSALRDHLAGIAERLGNVAGMRGPVTSTRADEE
jgi:hypothetical protein